MFFVSLSLVMSTGEYNLSIQKPMPPDTKKVFEGDIFSVWQWPQELFDGSRKTFERITRSDVTHAVGVLPNGKILLTEDAQPHRQTVLTPPGGMVEEGETPEEAVRREFLEETGYEIKELVPWHHYQPASDKIGYTCHAFVACKIEKKGAPTPEAGEKIKVLQFSWDEFLQLGSNPKMRDLVIRIILLEAQLDKQKRDQLWQLLYG